MDRYQFLPYWFLLFGTQSLYQLSLLCMWNVGGAFYQYVLSAAMKEYKFDLIDIEVGVLHKHCVNAALKNLVICFQVSYLQHTNNSSGFN